MKKILTALVGVFLLAGVCKLRADDEPLRVADKDIFSLQLKTSLTGSAVAKSTEIALGVSSGGAVYNTRGLVNVDETWTSVPGGITTGTVRSSTISGGIVISTRTLRENATTYTFVDIGTQPMVVPRNIILYSSPTFTGITTTTIMGSATFYGYNALGVWVSEAISFSTAPPNLSSATRVAGQGDVAWAFISSFTVQITSMTDAYGAGSSTNSSTTLLNMAWGNKLGLANDIVSADDLFYVSEGNTGTHPAAGRTNSDFNTYYPAVLPNGSLNYRARYRVKNSPRK